MVQAAIRKLHADIGDDEPVVAKAIALPATSGMRLTGGLAPSKPKASLRWKDTTEMLKELKLEQYTAQFEEEEMTSLELLEEIVSRGDGEKELMDALKEMGIKKMGHRQAIVGAVVGKL